MNEPIANSTWQSNPGVSGFRFQKTKTSKKLQTREAKIEKRKLFRH